MEDYESYERLHQAARNLEERRVGANILCGRCKHGMVHRRGGKLTAHAYCGIVSRYVPIDIVECTDYEDKKAMSLSEMHDIAVSVDKRKGVNDGSYV